MQKTILLTGATDGIGREAARLLIEQGHILLLHGRNPAKLESLRNEFAASTDRIETYVADLSQIAEVKALADAVSEKHRKLDVLINNAGVLRTPKSVLPTGLDVRFMVNTIAPYVLTKSLLPILGDTGRVINVSSAAQAPVNQDALFGKRVLSDMSAYSQSKLALTMWSLEMARTAPAGPAIIAVNPGSMLGSKMVKEAFGVTGGDLKIGAEILCSTALSDEFADASGKYYDNDAKRFSNPHSDALDPVKPRELIAAIEQIMAVR
jgi:NAD(P)-dependent dehydrogenase (short-subunit alcohol dehydrogenase family)